MIVVRREKYGKQSDNGIGIQSCDLSTLGQPSATVPAGSAINAFGGGFGPWYQVTESLEVDDLVCAKWTQPLLLGSQMSAGVLVKKVCVSSK